MRTLRRAHPGCFELVIFAVAYAIYFGVRALTRSDVSRAVAHAADILRLERRLDLDWETAVQGFVIGRGALVDAVNAVYVWGHWPVLIFGGFLLFHLGRREYLRLRTVILVSGALGLVVFGLFPVAPPRLAAVGLQDTVALHASAYHSILVPSLVNQYAAMPSFHAGWNLLLGIELFRVSRNVFVRTFAIVAPATMAFSVVATANHFVLDVIAGAVAVIVPLVVLSRLDPYSAPRRVRARPDALPTSRWQRRGHEGGDDITTFRKDVAATVATGLAALVFVATHEGWNVWLIGDSTRWAAVVMTLLALVVLVLERADSVAYVRLAVLAGLFAVLALISGELTALSLLLVTIVVLWFETTVRDAWHGTHHPTPA